MADIVLTVRIPDLKVDVASPAFLKVHPNIETVADPTWINPNDGSAAPQIQKYTLIEWVEEIMRRDLSNIIHRGRVMLNREANQIIKDDGMATV